MNIHVNKPYEIRDGETIRRAFTGPVIKSINKDSRQIEFVISTAAQDRYGDVITVSGWDLKKYRQNPVVLFGHLSSIPPIGKAIKTWKEDGALRSIAQFMTPDLSAFADSIFRMYLEGYLRAVSVGFQPLKYEAILDEDGNPTFGFKFIKQDLLEFSSVPIPANPEALVAAREKGIDTLPFKAWAEELLDNWQVVNKEVDAIYGASRKDVETIRRRAAGMGASIQVPLDIQDDLLRKNLDAVRKSKAEKATAKDFETVDIGGEEHELPVRKLKEGETIGHVVFTRHEDNGFDVTCADDFILMDPELVDSEWLSTSNYEGGSMLLVTFKGISREVIYELIGVNSDGDMFASKVKDSADEEKAEETVEPLPLIETTVITEPEVKVIEPVESPEPVVVKEVSEEPEEPITFSGTLAYVEMALNDFENSLEIFKQVTKHEERKKFFLASYMRELADRLDGGRQDTGLKEPVVTTTKTDKAVGFTTSADVQAYLKGITESLEPMLAEIVTSKLARLRGRLD